MALINDELEIVQTRCIVCIKIIYIELITADRGPVKFDITGFY